MKRMIVEDYGRGVDGGSQLEFDDPSIADIEKAIREMDGEQRTTVILQGASDESGFLGIGGGRNGMCFCFVVDDEQQEFVAFDPTLPAEIVPVLAGQVSQRSRQEMLPLETILIAARWFAQTGRRSSEVAWKEC